MAGISHETEVGRVIDQIADGGLAMGCRRPQSQPGRDTAR
jgi:hypothetical protein